MTEVFTSLKLVRGANLYSLYVLALLLFAYLLNQLDRYTLAIVTRPLAQEIHYGEQGCLKNESVIGFVNKTHCLDIRQQDQCEELNENGTYGCKWDYTGQGFQYQILAGPIFILIYTFAGIPMGIAADAYNRKSCWITTSDTRDTQSKSLEIDDKNQNKDKTNLWWLVGRALQKIKSKINVGMLLGVSVVFWSICTLLSGFVSTYWQLAVLRFGLGLGQAGCTPFAASLIADYFPEHLRGSALGVYNWGIYTGYSMSFALGNLITDANINGQGWRWTFIIAGLPGIFLGLLIMTTVKEPQRAKAKTSQDESAAKENTTSQRLAIAVNTFCRGPSILLLCLAGSIRNAAGYVWAYNTQVYYESIGQERPQIALYLSWIPMVAGSFGVLVGGFISDRFVVKSGPHGRIWVLIISQLIAAPFAAGALLLSPPFAYLSLIPTYIFGEMWVSVTLAVLVELVPTEIKTTAVAVYLFIISNIGGNMPLVVPALKWVFEKWNFAKTEALRYALLCLYPGEYVLGAILFLVTLFVLKRDIFYIQSNGNPKASKADIVTNMEKGAVESNDTQAGERELTKM